MRLLAGLFSGKKVTRILLSPSSDVYSVFAGDSLILLLNRNDVLSVSLQNDSLQLKNLSKELGRYKSIKLTALTDLASLKIKPAENSAAEMHCDDDFIINAGKNSLTVINHVDIDNYVASVVEAETGYSALPEYYKIQAIMCRTFAMESKGKHNSDGYDLCDREHCQVYKGRSNKKPDIKLAVAATSGIVLVDTVNKLVFAAYHSNCGGQTDYSENVWKTSKSYLVPVIDTFCLKARNAKWEKTISLEEWKKYLAKQSSYKPKPPDSLYHFYQPTRKINYDVFGVKIPLNQMRKDLKLNSNFFDIAQRDDKIVFSGRGSGHGVGLCQQGAMEMAAKGYSFQKILGFYYRGVKLVNYAALKK